MEQIKTKSSFVRWSTIAVLLLSAAVGLVHLGTKNAVAENNNKFNPIAPEKVLFEKYPCKGASEDAIRPCISEYQKKLNAITDPDYLFLKQIGNYCGGNPDDLGTFLLKNDRFTKYLHPRVAQHMQCKAGDAECSIDAKVKAREIARNAALRSERAVASLFRDNPDARYLLAEYGCFGEEEQRRVSADKE